MSERNTVLRSMPGIGLAGWCGGPLMGAVDLNGAAGQAPSPAGRLQIASAGWDRWAPVNLAAIGADRVGALLVVSSLPGEQQKPGSVRRGAGARVRQFLTPSA